MNNETKANEVRETVQRLIDSGCSYDIDALESIYHRDLKIVRIDELDRVTVIDREENIAFFRAKGESGAEPLSREAEFLHAEADEHGGYVVVLRRMKLADRPEKLIFSIRLVRVDGSWRVIDETAFARPAD